MNNGFNNVHSIFSSHEPEDRNTGSAFTMLTTISILFTLQRRTSAWSKRVLNMFPRRKRRQKKKKKSAPRKSKAIEFSIIAALARQRLLCLRRKYEANDERKIGFLHACGDDLRFNRLFLCRISRESRWSTGFV